MTPTHPPLQFSFGELAAALMVLSMLGGVCLWALSTKFATKKLVYFVKDDANKERKEWKMEIEKMVKEATDNAEECNRRHDLAKEPFANVVLVLREMKDDLKQMASRAEARDAKLIEAIQMIDKRVTVIEHTTTRRRQGRGNSPTVTIV